jgi:hypothetical protein
MIAQDVAFSSFREAFGQLGGIPAGRRNHCDFPSIHLLLRPQMIRQPVDVAKALRKHGASLRTAHETLIRLTRGKSMAIELTCSDASDVIRELAALGVEGSLIQTAAVSPEGREKELENLHKLQAGA